MSSPKCFTPTAAKYRHGKRGLSLAIAAIAFCAASLPGMLSAQVPPRERISIDDDWRFTKDDPAGLPVSLLYDVRPLPQGRGRGRRGGGAAPAATTNANTNTPAPPPPPEVIKEWILPSGNSFLKDETKWHLHKDLNNWEGVAYVRADFDDSSWRLVNLPHDWGIEGPFSTNGGGGGGGTGRLPFFGVGWYRKKLDIPAADAGKSIFLDVDGAMAYSTVWLNGKLVGGWPYGYASWRLDLSPYVNWGGVNQLAIRLDNPANSSRWYPGGGIYRNVWLVKTSNIHVAQWGTYLTTPEVSTSSATVDLKVTAEHLAPLGTRGSIAGTSSAATEIFELDANGNKTGGVVARIASAELHPEAGTQNMVVEGKTTIANPKLWGPPPQQQPNRYVAVTTITRGDRVLDIYETPFGIRTLKFDPDNGFFINGEHVKIKGVCDHSDLGALGSAVNYRGLQRQLEMLQDMGCNAIRTSHNPPAPELLELADQMGFLVMDEAFDTWHGAKTQWDYHLLFDDWHEQDFRAQIRRDRNHPSVIMWSIGNEVGEQTQGANGAAVAQMLTDIAHDEDPTRPTASAMNSARADSPFPRAIDTVGLNYQGAGNFNNSPQYPVFHTNFPDKFVFGSETESTVSTRGVYTFPVATGFGASTAPNRGEDVADHQVSSYDLYFPAWATSPDKEFAAQDRFSFVGGEFVWTGWDYLGEPTPFGNANDTARSSYFGIIDLAGFKKDRFYLYQAHWRPDLKMAHILPHWTWPERVGLTNSEGQPVATPVHVYTSGDEGELFLNGKSLGRKKKGEFEYRLRWDDVVYEPGTLKVVTYRNGQEWATDEMKTAGDPAALTIAPDRSNIHGDGHDLSFITVSVTDKNGVMAPRANNRIRFSVEGPGEIVATDNGDPTSLESFQAHDKKAFNGLCLVIVRAKSGQSGGSRGSNVIRVTATADGLTSAKASVSTDVLIR